MKSIARKLRHKRITKKIKGDKDSPRLLVFRSKKHIYAQLIDDASGKVISGCSTLTKEFKSKNIKSSDKAAAKEIGKMIAAIALKSNIKKVRFDRSGFKYHGRVKELADGSREGGLKF